MCDPRQSIDAEAADVCAARSLPSLIQTRGGRLGPAWPRTDFEDSLRYPSLYYYAEGQPSHPASHLFSRCVCVLVAFSVVLPACEQQFRNTNIIVHILQFVQAGTISLRCSVALWICTGIACRHKHKRAAHSYILV